MSTTTERANQTNAARAAWHELNDAVQAMKPALVGADTLPTFEQIATMQDAARRLFDTIEEADRHRSLGADELFPGINDALDALTIRKGA